VHPWPSFAKTETYTIVPVAKGILHRYAGKYQLTPTLYVDIVEDRGGGTGHAVGRGDQFPPRPGLGERSFVIKELSARLTFNSNAEGKAETLTWNRAGRDTVAPKSK